MVVRERRELKENGMGFEIRSQGGNRPHFPKRLLDGRTSTCDLELFIEPVSAHAPGYRHMWDADQTEIGNYFLPPFQRPQVWTDAQKTRFIESALLGVSLGSIVVVDAANLPLQDNGRFARTDMWLIDGYQRISALVDYRRDRLTPFAGTECEHRWSDLNPVEIRRFRSIQIALVRIASTDEDHLRAVYDLMNFGGTAHGEHQRAVHETST